MSHIPKNNKYNLLNLDFRINLHWLAQWLVCDSKYFEMDNISYTRQNLFSGYVRKRFRSFA